MEWSARFGKAALKSGACGQCGGCVRKGVALREATAEHRGAEPERPKGCATRSALNNKDTLRRSSKWSVWPGPSHAQWSRLPAPSEGRNTKLNEVGSKANTVGNEPVIRNNPGMCAHANQEPLPNWSFNRTANGMAPWPRGSVVHHLPRGQGAMPSAAG